MTDTVTQAARAGSGDIAVPRPRPGGSWRLNDFGAAGRLETRPVLVAWKFQLAHWQLGPAGNRAVTVTVTARVAVP